MVKLIQPFAFGENHAREKVAPFSGVPERARGLMQEPSRAIRVLAIDDDPEILENLIEALNPPVFAPRGAESYEDFSTQLDQFDPDVVITDLAMPSRDGMDVLKTLRDRAYAGDIVVMSGQDGHVLETVRRVANSYGLSIGGILRKPFAPDQLKSLLMGAEKRNEDALVSAALSERRIRPYFQPKIDLRTGRIVGAEALSRWYHPERGLLLPNAYLKPSGRARGNSLHDLTIVERTAEFAAKLNQIGQRLKLAVNLAADVVLAKEFVSVITDVQQRHGLGADQLIIELTEGEAAENLDELAERLLKLRLAGFAVSIDDFGTGHSSLSRLQKLPVNELKIDRSFISGLTEYSENSAIVRSIIELAHTLHCAVVAEGVETVQAMEALQALGCEMAQGFLFSPAVNESTFVALVRDNPFAFTAAESSAGKP
jgi:EAL domain-containing protein (putative c-di-GMP-specific phosphodiesterase class I)